jgi:hypothetical protein
VDELGNDLFASAAFSADEHRCISGGHFAGQVNGLPEERRYADQRDLVAVAVLFHELYPQVLGLAGHHDGM